MSAIQDMTWLFDVFDRDLAYAVAVVMAGGVILGFSGFGAGMIFVPLLTLIYGPREAVAFLMLIGTFGTSMLVPNATRHTLWRETLPMAIAAMAAIPIGSYLLLSIDADIMRRVIGISVLGLAIIMFRGVRYSGPRTAFISGLAGVVSGVVAGATGLGRLVVGLYFLSSGDSAAIQRANIIIVGSSLAVVNVVILTAAGIITLDLAIRAGVLFLPFAATIWLGSRFFRATTGTLFRRIVLALVMLIALTTVFV